MIPPIPILDDYNISLENGFLPAEPPLERLPDLYYAKWEAIITNLQPLLLSKRLRSVVEKLPILSTSRLQDVAEWRRAYVVLVFIAHGYIWGGDKPSEVRTNGSFESRSKPTEHSLDPSPSHNHPTVQSVLAPRAPPSGNICWSVSMELQTYIRRRARRQPREPSHPLHIHRLA